MMSNINDQILMIYHRVNGEEDFRPVWDRFTQCNNRLHDWMDTIPETQYALIDEYIESFFAVHIQMMELALTEKTHR